MCFHLQDTTLGKHSLLILTPHKQLDISLDCLSLLWHKIIFSIVADQTWPFGSFLFTKLFVRFLYVQ